MPSSKSAAALPRLATSGSLALSLVIASLLVKQSHGTLNVTWTSPVAGDIYGPGDFILGENVYGTNGVLAGAIVVAIVALIFEFALAGLQRRLTSKGLRLQAH